MHPDRSLSAHRGGQLRVQVRPTTVITTWRLLPEAGSLGAWIHIQRGHDPGRISSCTPHFSRGHMSSHLPAPPSGRRGSSSAAATNARKAVAIGEARAKTGVTSVRKRSLAKARRVTSTFSGSDPSPLSQLWCTPMSTQTAEGENPITPTDHYPLPTLSGPYRLGPKVPSRNPVSTRAHIPPTTGIRLIRIHHADLPRSCHRLARIARIDQNSNNDTNSISTAAPSASDRPSISETMMPITSKGNVTLSQNVWSPIRP